MPYTETANMGIKEFAVSRAIHELRTRGEPISRLRIAEYIGMAERQVTEALRQLERCGFLRRYGTSRGGYTYEVVLYDPDTVSGL